MADEYHELPLFPLNTVLFPHMNLPLRIFEPRYRQMLSYSMEHDQTFGIVLIKMGSEVGELATPYEIGTIARIVNSDTMEDGTIGVITVGDRRFQIESILQERPFPMARIFYPNEDATPIDDAEFQEIRTLGRKCLNHLMALNHQWSRDVDLPNDQEKFSYILPTRLQQLDNRIRQILLESPTLATRLGDERTILEEEEKKLHDLLLQEAWMSPNQN